MKRARALAAGVAVILALAAMAWSEGGEVLRHFESSAPSESVGTPAAVPCSPFNEFCYALHFDARGNCGAMRLDLPAISAHLRALAAAAPHHGLRIRVVIIDDSLRELLLADPAGRGLDRVASFSTKKPWIKHDQHDHVDFESFSAADAALLQRPDAAGASEAAKE